MSLPFQSGQGQPFPLQEIDHCKVPAEDIGMKPPRASDLFIQEFTQPQRFVVISEFTFD
jgi:hypothetical protein